MTTISQLKIHYSDIFTKPPERKYINDAALYIYGMDTDLFSIHELDDMVRELRYQTEKSFYYHFCIPEYPLDFGLLP